MKTKKLLFMLPALLLAGCSKAPSTHFDSRQLEKAPQKNVSSIVIKENIECTYPVKIAQYDSLFMIQDMMNQGYVYIFNSKGEKMDCLVKKGNGHTEISNAPSRFSIDKEKGVVSLYSAPYYVEYNVNNFVQNKTDFCNKTNCSELVSYPTQNAQKLTNGYLLEGFTGDMRFAVVDRNVRSIYTDYPSILPENKKDDIAAVLTYNSNVAVAPDKSQWVQASYIGGILEIFRYDGHEIKSVGINPIYEPVYEGKRQDVSWNEETVIGFDDVVATDKHIYTLLNGAKGKQLKSNPSVNPFTDQITVFDWNGDIKEIIHTDCMMMAIDIDEKENVCYAISFNLDHGYDLRKIPLS